MPETQSVTCKAKARHRTPTEVHDVVAAYSAIIHNNVPCPQGYCIPLDKLSHLVGGNSPGQGDLLTFLTSNRFLPSSAVPPAFAVLDIAFDLAGAEDPASGISTSFMMPGVSD